MSTTDITATTVLPSTVTATGLVGGEHLATVVDARKFDTFTATHVRQARVSATAYNADNGHGTHFGVGAHGVTGVTITNGMFGLNIRVMTESGQSLDIDLFAALVDAADAVDGERQVIAVVDRR